MKGIKERNDKNDKEMKKEQEKVQNDLLTRFRYLQLYTLVLHFICCIVYVFVFTKLRKAEFSNNEIYLQIKKSFPNWNIYHVNLLKFKKDLLNLLTPRPRDL